MMRFKTFVFLFAINLSLIIWSGGGLAAFNDVSGGHANSDAIDYVQGQGIVEGYEDGTYKPDNPINRAEFAKIIMGAVSDPQDILDCLENNPDEFEDVPDDAWFAPYVCMAFDEGIVQGYPDGTFKPSQNISFVEAAKIIVLGFNLPSEEDPIWYKPFVERLGMEGAIPLSIARFDKDITRGEMAEMIYRLKASVGDKESMEYYDNSLVLKTKPKPVEPEPEPVEPEPEPAEPEPVSQGALLAGTSSPFREFTQADFDAAVAANKFIVLYFYASWCPICRNELDDHAYPYFDSSSDTELVGFRVNYNDGDTDDDEKALAVKHKVTYQHTKVLIKDGQEFLKSGQSWDFSRYGTELGKLTD